MSAPLIPFAYGDQSVRVVDSVQALIDSLPAA